MSGYARRAQPRNQRCSFAAPPRPAGQDFPNPPAVLVARRGRTVPGAPAVEGIERARQQQLTFLDVVTELSSELQLRPLLSKHGNASGFEACERVD